MGLPIGSHEAREVHLRFAQVSCNLEGAVPYSYTDEEDPSHTLAALSTPPLFNCPRASALVAGGAFRLPFRSSVVKVAISLDFVDGPDCRTAVPLWCATRWLLFLLFR